MEFEARRFVRKVLLIHGGLLMLVLLIVGAAVRLLYASARQQAILQAIGKQELLASQTAVGIKNYYESVNSVLNLLQPNDPSATQPSTRPGSPGRRFERGSGRGESFSGGPVQPAPVLGEPPPDEGRRDDQTPVDGPRNRNGRFDRFRGPSSEPHLDFSIKPADLAAREARRRRFESGPMLRTLNFGDQIWKSIEDKSSMLFVVDPVDDFSIVRVIGSTDASLDPAKIAADERTWLGGVHSRSVSPYRDLNAAAPITTFANDSSTTKVSQESVHNNVHLIAIPLRGPEGLLMVAIIPISSLERNVLDSVNKSRTTNATLIDDKGAYVAAADERIVGHNISELKDPRIKALADTYIRTHTRGSDVFEEPRMLGNIVLPPGISTVEPVDVLGQKWTIVLRSTFDEVDDVVKPIFRDAVLCSAFLLIAMTVILISTSSQLILGRVRLERMQRQVMSREIDEARRIQLNWLPTGACANSAVNVAATNIPANHISGDFYNWFELPDGRTVVCIGDVTGHGMAAAFLMATTQLLVRNTMSRVHDPGEALEEVNRQLCVQAFAGQFVTLSILVLDPANCSMRLASAGHPAPLIGPDRDGRFTSMDVEPQLVLAVDPTSGYPAQTFELSDDTMMILYTDGVLDAVTNGGARYKLQGLLDGLIGVDGTAEEAIAAIRHSVDSFRAGHDLPDDLTIVAIRLHAEPSRREQKVVTI